MSARQYIGIDGCRVGWFVVSLGSGNGIEFGVFKTLESMWSHCKRADVILIDIPIGLPSETNPVRTCEKEARKALRPLRHSSVFNPPCREALTENDHQKAGTINQRICGRRLSIQSFHIAPKILEADRLLASYTAARGILRESHPEICFWAFNRRRPMAFNKRSEEGRRERLNILNKYFSMADTVFDDAMNRYQRKDVKADDIPDAAGQRLDGRSLIAKGVQRFTIND